MLLNEKESTLCMLLARASSRNTREINHDVHMLSHWSWCVKDDAEKLKSGRQQIGGGSYPWRTAPYTQEDYDKSAAGLEWLCNETLKPYGSNFIAKASPSGITVTLKNVNPAFTQELQLWS